MKAFLPRILTLILFCTAPTFLIAQIIHLNTPEIVRVTVDTSTGLAGVEWLASTSPDIKKYELYFDSTILGQQSWRMVGTVDGDTRQYFYQRLDPDVLQWTLTVLAYDTIGNRSNFTESHSTMHLNTFYDSCEKVMELNWTPYIGWGDDLVLYEVYYRVDQGPYTILKLGGTQKTTEQHLDMVENHKYCYFIKAIKNDGTFSTSNIACRNVTHPLHPAWINAESASAVGADKVEVKFAIDPAAEVTSYQLFRTDGPGKQFKENEIFRDVSDSLSYLDPVVSTEKRYRYKLYSLDVCEDTATVSNISGNIVLTAWSVGLEGFLAWNPYLEYEAGVKNYLIYRVIMPHGLELLKEVTPPDTTFTDDLSLISWDHIEDEICYFVEAEENDSYIRGNKGFSKSDIACISVVPEIQMANAFTPNGDGINEEIKPELTFIPHQFVFQVFDRWGSRIFQSSDPETGWDGRVNGGSMVPEGVYVYYIKLTTSSGIEVEKKGVITVIYP